MRKAAIIIILLLAFTAALATPATASATTTITNETFPVDTTLIGVCIGELHITGVDHVVSVVTVDDTGGTHVQFHDAFRYLGTNLTTGDVYRATGLVRGGSTSKEPTFTVTSVITEHFVSPTGPDLWVDLISHFTVNANGTTTTRVSMERVRCH
jgi:hypothetical protein